MAESWAPNEDGSKWTFKLRQGVKFHYCTPMKAACVVESINRIADPENGSLGLRSDINRAILSALRAHQIEIPYPQRVMHVQVDGAVPAAMSPGGTPAPAPASAG